MTVEGTERLVTRHCGLDPPVHRDENDEEQRSSALQAHTLAQRDRRLVNPEVKGGAYNKPTPTNTGPSYWLQGSIHRAG